MRDGYDFDYVFIDESTPWPSASEMKQALINEMALRELAQAAGEFVHSLADDMQQLLGIATESLKEVIDLICQYADEAESEDLKKPTFPMAVNCNIPKSEYLFHQNRIPWHTSGFQ